MISISFYTSSTDGPRRRSRPALGTSSARLQRALALPMICLGSVQCVELESICKLSGAYKVVRCPPTGRLKGPLEPNGCGAPGNFADGFTPPEMFLACATATAPVEGPYISPTVRLTVLERNVRAGRSDTLVRRLTTDLIPIVFITMSFVWQ